MKKFEYEITVQANDQKEADKKMKSVMTILSKLSTEELSKVEEVVSNPVKLALIKSKLM